MSEGVPAPRKRTQPTKPHAPSKKKVISQPKVEEAPPIINEDTDLSCGPFLPFTHTRVIEEKSV